MNNLQPWYEGIKQWSRGVADQVIRQLKANPGKFKKFSVIGRQSTGAYFNLVFDPKILKQTKRVYVVGEPNPSLPNDLMERLNMARMAVGRNVPLMGLRRVMDEILRRPDPETELDEITGDIVANDPVFLMQRALVWMQKNGMQEEAVLIQQRLTMLAQQAMGGVSGAGAPRGEVRDFTPDSSNQPPEARGEA